MEGHLTLFSHPMPSKAAKPPQIQKLIQFRDVRWVRESKELEGQEAVSEGLEGRGRAMGG